MHRCAKRNGARSRLVRYSLVALLLTSTGVGALPSHVEAKAPVATDFMRVDALHKALAARLQALKDEEEFKAKPRPEQLVILMKRGTLKSGREKLTGADVIEQVFEWKALRATTLDDSAKHTMKLLPDALAACYGQLNVKSRSEMRERYKASRELVDALMDKHVHVRQLAIDCLVAVYGETRGYKSTAPDSERKRIQKKWAKAIRR